MPRTPKIYTVRDAIRAEIAREEKAERRARAAELRRTVKHLARLAALSDRAAIETAKEAERWTDDADITMRLDSNRRAYEGEAAIYRDRIRDAEAELALIAPARS